MFEFLEKQLVTVQIDEPGISSLLPEIILGGTCLSPDHLRLFLSALLPNKIFVHLPVNHFKEIRREAEVDHPPASVNRH